MLRMPFLLALAGLTLPAYAESQFVSCDIGVRCIRAPCPSRDTVELGSGRRFVGTSVNIDGLSAFDKARKDLEDGLTGGALVLAGSVVGTPPEHGQIVIARVVRASTAGEMRLCRRRR